MATLTDITFLSTNLLTGAVIDEVELQSFNWNELYNRPGSGRATVRIDDPSATPTNFDSWRNGLWILAGGQPIWGGYMGPVSPVSGSRVLSVPVYGFMEYPRHRLIRNTQGMTHASLTYSGIKWEDVDVFDVAEDLIAHIQSFATGDIGIVVNPDALSSGNLITQTYFSYEFKPAGTAFEQLADNIGGFDWRYRFDLNGNEPRCNVILSTIPQGRRTGFRLEYDHKPGNKNILVFDENARTMPVNGVAAAGSGEGDSMVRTYVSDLGTGYPLFEGMISYKDVTSLTTLSNHANKHLTRNKVPLANVTVTLDQNLEPAFTEYICGDEMLVVVDDNWLSYEEFYRVTEKNMTLSKEHDIIVKIGLELVG